MEKPQPAPSHHSKPSETKPESSVIIKSTTKTIKVLTLMLVFLCAAMSACLTVGVDINLKRFQAYILTLAAESTGRQIDIDGDLTLSLSWQPQLKLQGLTIPGLPSDDDNFPNQPLLIAGEAQLQLSLLPLLSKRIEIQQFLVADTHLQLVDDHPGPNWQFPSQTSATPSPASSSDPFRIAIAGPIAASNLSVSYSDDTQHFSAYLDSLALSPISDSAVADNWQLDANGQMLMQPYTLTLQGQLMRLLDGNAGEFQFDGHYAGADISLTGQYDQDWRISTHIDWLNTQPIQQLLGFDAQHAAPLTITSTIEASPNHLKVDNLSINSPITEADGKLAIVLGNHNHIDGHLNIPYIDLRPWLQPEPMPMMRAFSSDEPQKSPLQLALDRWLKETSTSLSIKIGEILGLGTPVEELALHVNGREGILEVPVNANIANVRFEGAAEIDATNWVPALSMTLGATDSPLGDMAGWLTGMYYAKGHLTHAELALQTHGVSLKEWLNNSALSLEIDNAFVDWGAQAHYAITEARLTGGMHRPFQSHLQGEILGTPATFTFQAGTLNDVIMNQDWQAAIKLESPALNITGEGLLKQTRWQNGSHFNFSASSDNIALLGRWLGTTETLTGDLSLQGQLVYLDDEIHFSMPDIALLDTRGDLALRWKPSTSRPFLQFDAAFSRLDFSQFAQFLEDEHLPQVEQTIPTQGVNLDLPLLPEEIVIADADINLHVKHLQWEQQTIKQLRFKGKVRDGEMATSPFSAHYLGSHYQGDISLALSSHQLSAQLNIGVNDPNISSMLEAFDIAGRDDIEMTLNSASLALALQGRTLIELMEHADLTLEMTGGYLRLNDAFSDHALTIDVNNGHFVTGPNSQTHLIVTGEAQSLPVSIQVNSLSLKQINDGRNTIPLELDVKLGELDIRAKSTMAFPLTIHDLQMALHLSLPDLSTLNAFTGVDLPPYGPLSLSTHLSTRNDGYYLDDLQLTVNESHLTGNGHFLPPENDNLVPQIGLQLSAPYIQLDDFKTENWQAWLKEEATSTPIDQQAVPVVSPEGLHWAEVNLAVNVDEVRSGKDWLGAGELNLTLQDGQLAVAPLHINIPGGGVTIESQIRAEGEMFDIRLQGELDTFDYGIIARRRDPDTSMYGTLSTRFQLSSLANSPDTLMNNANGFIGFAAWPKAYDAGLIDLWAVSLTNAILPSFTDEETSLLNCVAAGIDITQGEMTQRELLLDTSRIQVNGRFNASYANRDFALYLAPRSKRAQIFGLQTPIEIQGSFEDFDFNVPWSAIFETSIRFTTSPVISPLRWLFERPIHPDGSAFCQEIWQG
ncbi:AsmA family protein [Thaumasiovibrio subtropicus]|uniref:AsmA family protein n=1 Tax=Thaumasiovibrio subtropicus TaxID=1891207 RepID=UPI000B3558EF|nr:AsmA family protein [Thaumasiovibrio subtropicus]